MRRKRGTKRHALGRSRGGVSTKLHVVVDAKARPLHVVLTPGQRHEASAALELIDYARGDFFLADTGYDSESIREHLENNGLTPVIPNHPRKKKPDPFDKKRYQNRYKIECFFHTLKRFRAIATRYEKTARNYLALIHLASATLWIN